MRTEALAKITGATLKLFAEYGYHGVTMKQIALATGLSYGLLYHYYPSKEKIFFHLVESALEISRNVFGEALKTPGSAWDKIEKLSELLYKTAFTDENSLYFLIMLQAITQGKGLPGLLEYIGGHTAHYHLLPPLIGEAQKSGEAAPGDPAVMASSYFALFQGYTLLLLDDKDLERKISPDTFTDILRNRERER
jgi:AcrR family transcriptional regulator